MRYINLHFAYLLTYLLTYCVSTVSSTSSRYRPRSLCGHRGLRSDKNKNQVWTAWFLLFGSSCRKQSFIWTTLYLWH